MRDFRQCIKAKDNFGLVASSRVQVNVREFSRTFHNRVEHSRSRNPTRQACDSYYPPCRTGLRFDAPSARLTSNRDKSVNMISKRTALKCQPPDARVTGNWTCRLVSIAESSTILYEVPGRST